ncbi:MAG TPA: protein kinase, partial [Polyangiaceae bacterium]|nr:protein kinase [Polyangiaceae bacterium]
LKLPSGWSPAQRNLRLASFRQEGRVLFQLAHDDPGIVRVLESGTVHTPVGAAPYLTLEWLEGASLAEELALRRRRGLRPFELGEVLRLLEAPALSLGRAHLKGIVHRDVKPANLFATLRDGTPQVKVLDFGLAELVGETSPEGPVLRGFTPRYAAPEQLAGQADRIGPWTDVHALASVCLEMLTGAPPDGERPAPAALGTGFPAEVAEALVRALEPEPSARFEDATAFWAALRNAAQASLASESGAVELASLVEGADDAESRAALAALPESPHDTQTNVTVTHPTASRSRAERGRTSAPRPRTSKALTALVLLAAVAAPLAQHEHSAQAPPVGAADSPRTVTSVLPLNRHEMTVPAGSSPSTAQASRPSAQAPSLATAPDATRPRRAAPEQKPTPPGTAESARLEPLPATRFAVSRTSIDFDDPALRRRK